MGGEAKGVVGMRCKRTVSGAKQRHTYPVPCNTLESRGGFQEGGTLKVVGGVWEGEPPDFGGKEVFILRSKMSVGWGGEKGGIWYRMQADCVRWYGTK